jgi:hypothetical protein
MSCTVPGGGHVHVHAGRKKMLRFDRWQWNRSIINDAHLGGDSVTLKTGGIFQTADL